MEYPKTDNLWVRDPETHLMAPQNGYRQRAFEQVNKWLVLEKIDGMNMRVIWDAVNGTVDIRGRTDRANIPGDLLDKMRGYFDEMRFHTYFTRVEENTETGVLSVVCPEQVILYGEGYGAGIQKGAHYRDDKDFMLFDVCVDGNWWEWARVEEIAAHFGCETVPVLSKRTMATRDVEHVVSEMCEGDTYRGRYWHRSWVTSTPEGVIARTDPYLFNGYGGRVMFKHKVRDVKPYLEQA